MPMCRFGLIIYQAFKSFVFSFLEDDKTELVT
jgi:hypothetical protein